MTALINTLRHARKARDRRAKDARARENRALFGRLRHEREKQDTERALDERPLEGARRIQISDASTQDQTSIPGSQSDREPGSIS